MKRIAYSFLATCLCLPCSRFMIRIPIFVSILFFPICLFGQGKFEVGFFGGVTMASQVSPSGFILSSTPKPGFIGGLEFGYYHWNTISYRLQILFDQKGAVFRRYPLSSGIIINMAPRIGVMSGDDFYYDAPEEITTSLNYIDIPLTIKVPIIIKESQFYIFGGPTVGIFLNGKTNSVGSSNISDQTPPPFKAPSPDIGIVAGIGISHSFVNHFDYYFEVGYVFNYSKFSYNVFYNGYEYTMDTQDAYSREIRITFGVLFGRK
jgi:hypothetical protein